MFKVKDEKAPITKVSHPKADSSNQRHLAASVPGVITLKVKVGDQVKAGDRVAIIEAMKMESAVTAAVDGKVVNVTVASGAQVEPGDLVVELG